MNLQNEALQNEKISNNMYDDYFNKCIRNRRIRSYNQASSKLRYLEYLKNHKLNNTFESYLLYEKDTSGLKGSYRGLAFEDTIKKMFYDLNIKFEIPSKKRGQQSDSYDFVVYKKNKIINIRAMLSIDGGGFQGTKSTAHTYSNDSYIVIKEAPSLKSVNKSYEQMKTGRVIFMNQLKKILTN